MTDWTKISAEAERVAAQLTRNSVDLAEAEKAGDYYVDHDYSDAQMQRYLTLLANNPPERSKRSRRHYNNIRDIWRTWRTELQGQDKARAWGWGVRLAKTGVQ